MELVDCHENTQPCSLMITFRGRGQSACPSLSGVLCAVASPHIGVNSERHQDKLGWPLKYCTTYHTTKHAMALNTHHPPCASEVLLKPS